MSPKECVEILHHKKKKKKKKKKLVNPYKTKSRMISIEFVVRIESKELSSSFRSKSDRKSLRLLLKDRLHQLLKLLEVN